MCDSGDKPTGYQTTTVSKDPWGPQGDYLKTGFARAQSDILDKPVEMYPNSTVVPFSPQTEQALQLQEARGIAGNPTVGAAQGQLQSTLAGNYLNSNPNFDAAVAAATRPLTQAYETSIQPGIDARFSASGRLGGGNRALASGQAAEAYQRALGDVSGTMAYKGYQDERGQQMRAAALAPYLAEQDIANLNMLRQVGQTREQQAGANLQEQINRFNFAQQEPRTRVQQFLPMIAGGQFGGNQTSTAPIYSNPVGQGLGYAAQGAGIGASLFGQGGIFPGLFK